MIINLDADWFLDCDERNVTLTERRVIRAKEEGAKGIAPNPENIGKIREVQHGYYGSISAACQGYLKKGIASMEGAMTAAQLIAAWEEAVVRIERACKPLHRVTLADASEDMVLAKEAADRAKTTGVEQTPKTSPAAPAFTLPQA